jgi:hypothetical protein
MDVGIYHPRKNQPAAGIDGPVGLGRVTVTVNAGNHTVFNTDKRAVGHLVGKNKIAFYQ